MGEPARGRTARVIFAGGGTLGHLAPGFAVADELEARGITTVFLTPGMAQERAWFSDRAAPVHSPADRLPRKPWALARFAWRLRQRRRAAENLLEAMGAACVVALGGWPCVPALLAARRRKLHLTMVVADETPGLVIRRWHRHAARVYAAHDAVKESLGASVRVVGPMLRGRALEGVRDATRFGLRADRATLLVTGGSLGAEAINTWVVESLEACLEEDPSLADRIQVLHSAGRGVDGLEARYAATGLAHHVAAHIESMGDAYASADLFLGRGGAGTVAEVRAWSLPAVIVPYPHHRDMQQARNAAPLVQAGLATVLAQADLSREAFDRCVLRPLLARSGQARQRGPAVRGAVLVAEDLIALLGES